jgi:hypothetical protein
VCVSLCKCVCAYVFFGGPLPEARADSTEFARGPAGDYDVNARCGIELDGARVACVKVYIWFKFLLVKKKNSNLFLKYTCVRRELLVAGCPQQLG